LDSRNNCRYFPASLSQTLYLAFIIPQLLTQTVQHVCTELLMTPNPCLHLPFIGCHGEEFLQCHRSLSTAIIITVWKMFKPDGASTVF